MSISATPPPRRLSRAARTTALALVASTMAWIGAAAPAEAAPPSCTKRTNNTYAKLLECVTLDGVRAHQAALQAIADANDDEFYPRSRVAGTKGYADSVDYVAGKLRAAGYTVTLDPFDFQFVFPALLRQLSPVNGGLRDRHLHRVGQRRRHRHRDPGRPRPGPTAGEHQWLRGNRLHRARLLRWRRHRPDPARHLPVRRQGGERRSRRRRSRHHLQRRQHPHS